MFDPPGHSKASNNTLESATSRSETPPRVSRDSFAVCSVTFPEVVEEGGHGNGTDNHSVSNSDPSESASLHINNLGKLRLAQRETQQICWLRGMTIVIFMLAAALVSLAIFYSTTGIQEAQFEQVFEEQAFQIMESFSSQLVDLVQSLDQLAVQYYPPTSTNTLPNYEQRASGLQQLSHAAWIGMAPLVVENNRTDWEEYSVQTAREWTDEAIHHMVHPPEAPPSNSTTTTTEYFPLWQNYPVQAEFVNLDLLQTPNVEKELRLAALSEPPTFVLGKFSSLQLVEGATDSDSVTSLLYLPIVADLHVTGVVLGWMDWSEYLKAPLGESADGLVCILSNHCAVTESQAFQVVAKENEPVTLKVLPEFLPSNTLMLDLEQVLEVASIFEDMPGLTTNIPFHDDYCPYTLHIYPTFAVRDRQLTNQPTTYTVAIVGVFVFCSIVFLVYDCLVERRQRKVMKSAARTHEIVAGLFPEVVRKRLFGESDSKLKRNSRGGDADEKDEYLRPQMVNLDMGENNLNSSKSRPIADLCPNTTVLFADIAGFTAWSSVRDPSQVFFLLETIYAAFDKLALQRKVFKVETIGDCYVAVTGLPAPQELHAVIMVKFARDCLKSMQELSQSLEVELGPDTGDLSIRIGMHSGPVTAGVLRGQKSRFQLFGDTVNTASRMESNGFPNQIHCSQQTADLLILAKKGHWIHPRKDMVHAKGKGLIQTYWVIASKAKSSQGSRRSLNCSSRGDDDDQADITTENVRFSMIEPLPPVRRRPAEVSPHVQRLIDWNVDMLCRVIQTIQASQKNRRDVREQDQKLSSFHKSFINLVPTVRPSFFNNNKTPTDSSGSESNTSKPPSLILPTNPRDEYCEVIHLPHFDPYKLARRSSDLMETVLDETIRTQLRDYVTTIACAYNDNPFHNFEHASHVTMSANKILKRVVNADHVKVRNNSLDNLASKIHDYTYGITSDPLTHFACLFSALIHDVDHPGISNAQMLKEKHALAEVYDGKSIAEQNSFDFAWGLLMETQFDDLRDCLFENEEDLKRFRQLVINSIMATDVFDPDLVKLRNERWRKAFPPGGQVLGEEKEGDGQEESCVFQVVQEDTTDLRATIVIEHVSLHVCFRIWCCTESV
jgi:class 3 adenylate cyclase